MLKRALFPVQIIHWQRREKSGAVSIDLLAASAVAVVAAVSPLTMSFDCWTCPSTSALLAGRGLILRSASSSMCWCCSQMDQMLLSTFLFFYSMDRRLYLSATPSLTYLLIYDRSCATSPDGTFSILYYKDHGKYYQG